MPFNLVQFVLTMAALVVGITIHEFSHGLTARQLGDPTAERMGRLSLNPLVHLDPLGTVMMVISALFGAGIGWGKPTPVNPWNLRPRGRVGMAIVALGGPVSNLLLAFVLTMGLRLAGTLGVVHLIPAALATVLYMIILVNVYLAAFNLLPLPMLDGYHVLVGVVSSIRTRWASDLTGNLDRFEAQGPMLLLVLILAGNLLRFNVLGYLMEPVVNLFFRLLGLS